LVYYDLEQYEKAISNYNKAIQLNPNDANTYNGRGLAYYDLEQYENAISNYNKAIQLNPNDANTYNGRGLAYYKLEQYKKAISDFKQAIELNLETARIFYFQGNAYKKLREYQKAISSYTRAIETDNYWGEGSLADAYYKRSLTYKELGNINKARSNLEKAAELYQKKGNEEDHHNAMEKLALFCHSRK